MRDKLLEKVAASKSHEITQIAHLGQIANIGVGRARKLLKVHSREGRDISVRDWALENCCPLRIGRIRTGSIFRPNNDFWKQSCAKIIKGTLSGASGY